MDTNAYLDRIGYRGPTTPTAETLRMLQAAHLLTVPFENLDVYLKRPIVLDQERLFAKIVGARRGGFCYELNSLFAALLRSLGFQVDLLAAEVAHDSGGFGPPFDHLALHVSTQELASTYLVDVGFGDSFRVPLRFVADEIEHDGLRAYRIVATDDTFVLEQHDTTGAWRPGYRFTLQPYALADFNPMCHYHQTSPETSFTQRRICTLAQPAGRITLSDLRLITTREGSKDERLLDSEAAWHAALAEHFGVRLSDG